MDNYLKIGATTLTTIPIWLFSAVIIGKIFSKIVLPDPKDKTFIAKREFKIPLVLGSLFGFVASLATIMELFSSLSPLSAKPLLIQASVLFPSVLIGSIVGVIITR